MNIHYSMRWMLFLILHSCYTPIPMSNSYWRLRQSTRIPWAQQRGPLSSPSRGSQQTSSGWTTTTILSSAGWRTMPVIANMVLVDRIKNLCSPFFYEYSRFFYYYLDKRMLSLSHKMFGQKSLPIFEAKSLWTVTLPLTIWLVPGNIFFVIKCTKTCLTELYFLYFPEK